MESQRAGHDGVTFTFTKNYKPCLSIAISFCAVEDHVWGGSSAYLIGPRLTERQFMFRKELILIFLMNIAFLSLAIPKDQ